MTSIAEMMAKVSNEAWVLIGSGIGVVLAAVLLAVMGSMREALLRLVPKMINRLKRYPAKKDVEQNHRIYTSLVELRVKTDADRAYVLRFHNGSDFIPNNPVWKISCTHETVRSGVAYESAQMQGLLVSRVHNVVDAVIVGESVCSGVVVSDCSECSSRQRCRRENKHVVVIQTSEMENSYSRFMLENQNVKTSIHAGVVNGGRVFGIVGVSFCDSRIEGGVLADAVEEVCKFAERIQYCLLFSPVSDESMPRR